MVKPLVVKAAWDGEAKVWYIEHSSLPGLHLEAETPIELYNKLPGAIEDLLEGNGEQEVSFELIAPGRVNIAA
jgi:predicted RNase H-like HicB family nuclease